MGATELITQTHAQIVGEILKCENKVNLKQKDLIAWRFWQGKWVAEALADGVSTYASLNRETGISATTLSECYRFYRCPQFGSDPDRLKQWLNNGGRALYWKDVQELIGSDKNPEVIGHDRWIDRGIQYIERTGTRIDEMVEHLTENTGTGREEDVESAIIAFQQSALAFANVAGNKQVIPRARWWLDWVATLPCYATGIEDGTVVAHHVGWGGGVAEKPSDFLVIPVSFKVHDFIHNNSEREAEERWNFSILMGLVDTMHRGMTSQKALIPPSLLGYASDVASL